jgi:hypothetical protein
LAFASATDILFFIMHLPDMTIMTKMSRNNRMTFKTFSFHKFIS